MLKQHRKEREDTGNTETNLNIVRQSGEQTGKHREARITNRFKSKRKHHITKKLSITQNHRNLTKRPKRKEKFILYKFV